MVDEQPIPQVQVQRSTNPSPMQLLMIFTLVSIVVNQLIAYIAQVTAGKNWHEIFQSATSFWVSSAANVRREVVDVDL